MLVRFPVSDYLPPATAITSAKLGLYVQGRTTTKAIGVNLYPINRAWNDEEATWTYYQMSGDFQKNDSGLLDPSFQPRSMCSQYAKKSTDTTTATC